MNNKVGTYILVLLAGIVGIFVTLLLMNSFSKITAVILVGIIYFFGGLGVGGLGLQKSWLAWVLLASPVCLTFGDITLDFFDLSRDHPGNVWMAYMWLAAMPPLASLAGLFFGKNFQNQDQLDFGLKRPFKKFLEAAGTVLVPLGLGFMGMFLAMIINFILYMNLQNNPDFKGTAFISYPISFGLIAGLLGYYRKNWLLNSLLVCAFPAFYFLLFIPLKNTTTEANNANHIMFPAIFLTIIVAVAAGFFTHKMRERRVDLSAPSH